MNVAPFFKRYEFLVEACIYAAALTPLIVTPQSAIFPFVFPKVIFFEAIVGILVAALIPLVVWSPDFRLKRSLFVATLVGYMIVLFLTGLHAFDTTRAFWSNYERMSGVVLIWHAIILCLAVATFYSARPQRLMNYLVYQVGVSVVVSLAGLLQVVSPSFLGLNLVGNRISGTFGNPIYLGGYAAQCSLLAAYLAYYFRKGDKTWWFIGAAIINLAAVYFSGTRSALVGLVVAGGCFAIAFVPRVWRAGHKRAVTASIGGIIVLVGLLFGLVKTHVIPESSQLARFFDIGANLSTASTRLIAWQIALKGFAERPVLGWGPENFYYVFNQHYNPKLLEFGAYETWFDHAHNAPFDILVTQGLVGILVYLLQYVVIWWMCFKTKTTSSEERVLSYILAAFFVVHFVHNIFVFDHPGSYAMYYLFAGIVAARYFASQHEAAATGPKMSGTHYGWWVGALQIIVLIIAGYVTIPSVRQNHMDLMAQAYAPVSLETSEQYFKQALLIDGPHTADVLLDVGRTAQRMVPPGEVGSHVQFFNFAIGSLDTLLANYEPSNVLAMLLEGQLLTQAVEEGDQNAIAKADGIFARAVADSPERQQLYYSWARLKFLTKRPDEGKKLLQTAIDADPHIGTSHWYMAIFTTDIDPALSLKELNLALENGFLLDNQQAVVIAASIYEKNNQFDKAADVYWNGIRSIILTQWTADLVHSAANTAEKSGRKDLLDFLHTQFPAVFQNTK